MFFIKKKQFYINGTQNLAETRGHFDGLFFSSFFLVCFIFLDALPMTCAKKN